MEGNNARKRYCDRFGFGNEALRWLAWPIGSGSARAGKIKRPARPRPLGILAGASRGIQPDRAGPETARCVKAVAARTMGLEAATGATARSGGRGCRQGRAGQALS